MDGMRDYFYDAGSMYYGQPDHSITQDTTSKRDEEGEFIIDDDDEDYSDIILSKR